MSRLLPSLGWQGSAGLQAPDLVDFERLPRTHPSNSALAAPSDFRPPPDLATQDYRVTPQAMFAAAQAAVLAQPRTVPHGEFPDALQAHFVVRSAVIGFPDLVVLQVLPSPGNSSQIVIWSRSVYGRYDFGVNRRRLIAWLSAIEAALPSRKDP